MSHRTEPRSGLPWAALVVALWMAPANAQLQLSGSLDVAYKQDVAQDAGEADSHINHSLKGQSPFSLLRTRLFADAEVADDVAVFTTTLYDEGVGHFEMEGAYLIFSSVAGREALNLEVGKMATPFGRFAARSFATVNPLIGLPLIYHHFSAVQGNRVPADAAQQLGWRQGATGAYRVRGLPTIYDACWNTGVQLFGATRHVAYAVAVTKGALSNPAARDNDGAQIVGRVGAQPTIGLQVGVSAAWGPYLSEAVGRDAAFPANHSVEDFAQAIVGVDAAYSIGRSEWLAEIIHSRWEVPNLSAGDEVLSNTGGYFEAAFGLRPNLGYALRLGHIRYAEIDDGSGRQVAWDYDITRVETGFEYYVTRDIRLKAVVQLNRRDAAATDDSDHMVGAQLASRF